MIFYFFKRIYHLNTLNFNKIFSIISPTSHLPPGMDALSQPHEVCRMCCAPGWAFEKSLQRSVNFPEVSWRCDWTERDHGFGRWDVWWDDVGSNRCVFGSVGWKSAIFTHTHHRCQILTGLGPGSQCN